MPLTACEGFSFSMVNRDTYENLIGENKLIHPDSLVINNTKGDVMHHMPYSYSDGWYTIEEFSPFQEITCFNQCKWTPSLHAPITYTYISETAIQIHWMFITKSDEKGRDILQWINRRNSRG
ncbi:MAG: hypothetical protein RIC35_04015 [Marinoscillum sp.]